MRARLGVITEKENTIREIMGEEKRTGEVIGEWAGENWKRRR